MGIVWSVSVVFDSCIYVSINAIICQWNRYEGIMPLMIYEIKNGVEMIGGKLILNVGKRQI
jgi:hypothetical protein